VDNLTHSLVGLAAAKAGLGRRTPYATFMCVAASNLPDIDIVALVRGPAFYLEHHRGITHSIVGTLALAFVFPMLFYAAERVWARARGREPRASLKGLLVCSLLLSASHPLLDWTNSYGVRPFLPWDGSWMYGDLLFIVDPWVWLSLGGACFLLAKTRWSVVGWAALALLITFALSSIASQRDEGLPTVPGTFVAALVLWCAGLAAFGLLRLKGVGARFGGRVAVAALAFVVVYCGALSVLHARARSRAELLAGGLASRQGERVQRVAATPVLADPLTWRCMADTDRSTFRFDMRLNNVFVEDLRNVLSFDKPTGEEAEVMLRASEDEGARVLLDFARFPVARVWRANSRGWVVQFADLRYTEPGERARVGGFALNVKVEPPNSR
jgi:inner membrane protein